MNVLPIDAAYAAGFFDGEGHIRIQKHSARCNTYMLQASISQATKEPLDWFVNHFGGTIKRRVVSYKHDGRVGKRCQWTWQVSSSMAEAFVRSVLPYIKTKNVELEIALQFRKTFRPQHVSGGHKKMDDMTIAYRKFLGRRMKLARNNKREKAEKDAGIKFEESGRA